MVAGATGIDLFLLVIDAAEGARPQTLEHLAILRLLGVERGVVAVTKSDLVDEETLEIALEEARELVPGAEVVAVSAKTGAGLDELRAALARVADAVTPRDADAARRASTSTASSPCAGSAPSSRGRCGRGRSARATCCGSPRAEARCASAAVQVHDTAVPSASAGERVALGLPGVERRELRRGDALVTPGAFPVSYRLDVELEELDADRERRARLRAPRHLADPRPRGARRRAHGAAAARGARRRGPRRPRRPPRRDDARRRDRARPGAAAAARRAAPRAARAGRSGLDRGRDRRCARRGRGARRPRAALARGARGGARRRCVQADGWAFSQRWLEETRGAVAERLRARAEESPLEPGLAVAELLPPEPWAPAVLPLLPIERRGGIAYLPGVAASLGARARRPRRSQRELEDAGPRRGEGGGRRARALPRGARAGSCGSATGSSSRPTAYARARELVVEECRAAGEITLARFRDLAGVGRRDAQLLLERLDQDGVTRRLGDRRVLRRAAGATIRSSAVVLSHVAPHSPGSSSIPTASAIRLM